MFSTNPKWSHRVLDFCLQDVLLLLLQIILHFWWLVSSNYLLLDSILADCMFLETWLFLLGCPICWHVTVHTFWWFLCTSVLLVVISLFYFLFTLLGSSLFSWLTWVEVCYFYLSFQKTNSWSYWTFMLLFLSLFYFISDLYYFLPSTDFRHCLFFFFFIILLGYRLVVYLRFFFLLEEELYCSELPF